MSSPAGKRRAARPERMDLEGPAGPLEALVETPGTEPEALALVCHPHPLHGGTMHNKVVFTLARSFFRLGAAAVRFNFRGVGRSAGGFADGEGERDDALGVAAWMQARWPERPLYMAGFSFGAAVALACCDRVGAAALVTVAPPVERIRPGFAQPRCRWLIVQGGEDEIVDARAVRSWAESLDPAPALVEVPEAGHFFHGRLSAVGNAVAEFFAEEPRPAMRGGG